MIETISSSPIAPSAMRLRSDGEIGIEAAIEADHQRRAGLLDDFEAGADALDVEIDRLLAEDGLAGARGALDQIGVRVGRRADRDGVDVLGGRGSRRWWRPWRPSPWPERGRRGGSASATKATSLSVRAATLPAWILPIRPAPMMPNLMRLLPQSTAPFATARDPTKKNIHSILT